MKLIIENFKSINKLILELDRVTVLIGPPAAGKSNILEAIALVGYPWRLTQGRIYGQPQNIRPLLSRIIRASTFDAIFPREGITRTVNIRVEGVKIDESTLLTEGGYSVDLTVKYEADQLSVSYCGKDITAVFKQCLNTTPQQWLSEALPMFEARLYSYDRYDYTITDLSRGQFPITSPSVYDILLETGENLIEIVRRYADILIEINELLGRYLKTRVDIRVLRSIDRIVIFDNYQEITPSLLSEGIWRMLYYVAALYSTKQYAYRYGLKDRLIVLLEEPDAHTFPYFAYLLTELIRDVSQYVYVVLTTHNSIFASMITSKVPQSVMYYVYRDEHGWTQAKK